VLPAFIAGVALIVGGAFALFQTPARGSIQLITSPSDARVLFDGRPVSGNRSPFVIANVRPSTPHSIEVSSDGFSTWSTRLTVGPGQTLQLPEVALVSIPRVASPSVEPGADQGGTATSGAAEVEREAPEGVADPSTAGSGSKRPKTGAATPRSTASARESSSARPVKASAAAPAPKAAPVVQAPKAASAPANGDTGMLRINSRPWSQVRIDGRLVGNTPQMSLRLSPGKHTVLLVNPDFGLRHTMTVQIKRGAVVTKIVDLAP
jgi:hypothetical protein